MKKTMIVMAGISALALSGCVSQDQADAKMAKGCAAGIGSLIAPKEIKEVKSQNFSAEENAEGMHRRVTLDILQKDGWVETDKSYSCLFAQEWGFLNMNHRALVVQIKIDDTVYGKKDGEILGGFQDFLKLTEVMDAAMAQ
jgi:hypothetical protein